MLESLDKHIPVGFARKSSFMHTYVLRNHIPKILCILMTDGAYAPDATCIATPLGRPHFLRQIVSAIYFLPFGKFWFSFVC